MTKHEYSKSDIAYLKRNNGKLSGEEMAAHIGVPVAALKMKIRRLRQNGFSIPDARIVAIGEIVTRHYASRKPRQFQKTADGSFKEVTPKRIKWRHSRCRYPVFSM